MDFHAAAAPFLAVRILAACILFTPNARAADSVVKLPMVDRQDVRFTRIAVDWGSLPRSIYAIDQDNYGFLWLGTHVGLYRYDGYSLKPYRHDRDDPNSLSDDLIKVVHKDRAGILWIGTGFGGLDRFDPAEDRFTHYRHDPNDERSLSSNTVNSVYQDRSGALWVATDGGLDRLDTVNQSAIHYRHDPWDSTSLSNNSVLSLLEDRQGNLWAGTAAGLNRLNRATGRFTRFPHDPKGTSDRYGDYVSAVLEDESGVVWLASAMGHWLRSLDPATNRFTEYTLRSGESAVPSLPGITSIQAGTDGAIWLGTDGGGLLKLNRERRELSRYRNDPGDAGSVHHNYVQALFRDADGAIWVCAKDMFARFTSRRGPFENYYAEPGNPNGLRDGFVWSVREDTEGWLWVGTPSGLHRLNRKTGALMFYRHDPGNPHGLSGNLISAIGTERSGVVWFGTLGQGINRFERSTGRFLAYRHNPNQPGSLSHDDVYCLLVDRRGVLWVGTGAGLDRFDPATGRFTLYRSDAQHPEGPSDAVTVIFEDRDGLLWLGTPGGLYRFDAKTDRFTAYRHQLKNPDSLSHNQVNAILEDRQGTLWVGTQNALDRWDRSGAVTATFTRRDGLPEDAIKAILEDDQGDLWLVTSNGLGRFHPATRACRNYSEIDGLPTNLLNPGWQSGSYRAPGGEMLIGTVNGLTAFYPDRLPSKPYVPKVLLTDFLLYNKPVRYSGNSPLRKAIWATDSVTLTHDQSIFTLEFAALSYQAREKNRYRYRLQGLETDWNEVDSKRSWATYTSLPTGKYVFQLQASHNDGVWNEQGVALPIIILPPWWATWWFRSMAALSVAGIAWAAHSTRVRRLQMEAARLESQVLQRTSELSERTRELEAARDAAESASRAKSTFLANMSHELRTPLNAILGFSHLLREGQVSQEQRRDLDIINRSGEHLLNLINDVLDVAKIEAGRKELKPAPCQLDGLVRDVLDMTSGPASAKDLNLRVIRSDGIPRYVLADAPKLRQVLINLLGNAIKYTERGSVTLRVDAGPAGNTGRLLLRFHVEDTGRGISAEDQARIFEPFVQVGSRGVQQGAGLGLAITRQFVQLMGGTIRVESAVGNGSRFHVEVPVESVQEAGAVAPVPDTGRVIGLEAGGPEFRILIVEDESDNRMVLQRLLQNAGFLVRVAAGGMEGVALFRTWRPHFIWMDLHMPVMDGFQATAQIRALDGGSEVKIAAITATVFADQQAEVMAAGLDDIIRKPYRPGEVFACMARHLAVRYRLSDAEPPARGKAAASPVPEALASLPGALRAELRDALMTLDQELIGQAIGKVSQLDAALGAALARQADRFAYTAMLRAVRAAPPVPPPPSDPAA
ncbi:MAG TPA: two-component regulator propeller domain-containing protein [Candidatus Acidoferrales bacterium]|nr:two-component regulator propeller domain-containing protein [Candidatus Acidoferrales bacterium]